MKELPNFKCIHHFTYKNKTNEEYCAKGNVELFRSDAGEDVVIIKVRFISELSPDELPRKVLVRKLKNHYVYDSYSSFKVSTFIEISDQIVNFYKNKESNE
jgi:hypothetical protein